MSLPTLEQRLSTLIAIITQIIEGPASGEGSVISTPYGDLPTIAKVQEDMRTQAAGICAGMGGAGGGGADVGIGDFGGPDCCEDELGCVGWTTSAPGPFGPEQNYFHTIVAPFYSLMQPEFDALMPDKTEKSLFYEVETDGIRVLLTHSGIPGPWNHGPNNDDQPSNATAAPLLYSDDGGATWNECVIPEGYFADSTITAFSRQPRYSDSTGIWVAQCGVVPRYNSQGAYFEHTYLPYYSYNGVTFNQGSFVDNSQRITVTKKGFDYANGGLMECNGNGQWVGADFNGQWIAKSDNAVNWTIPLGYKAWSTYDGTPGEILYYEGKLQAAVHIPTLNRWVVFNAADNTRNNPGLVNYPGYFYFPDNFSVTPTPGPSANYNLFATAIGYAADSGAGYAIPAAAWAQDRIVAVIQDYDGHDPTRSAVVTSPDGLTWTVVNNSNPFHQSVGAGGFEPMSGQMSGSAFPFNRLRYQQGVLHWAEGGGNLPFRHYTSSDKGANWKIVDMVGPAGRNLYGGVGGPAAVLSLYSGGLAANTWSDRPFLYTTAAPPPPDSVFGLETPIEVATLATVPVEIEVTGRTSNWTRAIVRVTFSSSAAPAGPDDDVGGISASGFLTTPFWSAVTPTKMFDAGIFRTEEDVQFHITNAAGWDADGTWTIELDEQTNLQGYAAVVQILFYHFDGLVDSSCPILTGPENNIGSSGTGENLITFQGNSSPGVGVYRLYWGANGGPLTLRDTNSYPVFVVRFDELHPTNDGTQALITWKICGVSAMGVEGDCGSRTLYVQTGSPEIACQMMTEAWLDAESHQFPGVNDSVAHSYSTGPIVINLDPGGTQNQDNDDPCYTNIVLYNENGETFLLGDMSVTYAFSHTGLLPANRTIGILTFWNFMKNNPGDPDRTLTFNLGGVVFSHTITYTSVERCIYYRVVLAPDLSILEVEGRDVPLTY